MHISKYDDVTHNRKFATGYASNRSLELESFSGKSIGLGQSSFNFHGVKIWNKIPLSNKSLSWHSFTKYYSSLLLKQY